MANNEVAFRDLMRKIKKLKDDCDGKLHKQRISKFAINGDEDEEQNLNFNLKADCQKHMEKKSVFPVQDEWKSSEILKKKER